MCAGVTVTSGEAISQETGSSRDCISAMGACDKPAMICDIYLHFFKEKSVTANTRKGIGRVKSKSGGRLSFQAGGNSGEECSSPFLANE